MGDEGDCDSDKDNYINSFIDIYNYIDIYSNTDSDIDTYSNIDIDNVMHCNCRGVFICSVLH